MTIPRTYCSAVARAIYELDQCSLRGPQTGQDKRDWDEARNCSSASWTAMDSSWRYLAKESGRKAMNSFSTGSGTVTYETVRKAMDGEPFTMSLVEEDEIKCRHFSGQRRHRLPSRSLYCPDRGDSYEGGKRMAGKLVMCRTLECRQRRVPARPSSSSLRIGPWGRRDGECWHSTCQRHPVCAWHQRVWRVRGQRSVGVVYRKESDRGRLLAESEHGKMRGSCDHAQRVAAKSAKCGQHWFARISLRGSDAVFANPERNQIRLVAIRSGLVRIREHPRYVSVRYAAESDQEKRFCKQSSRHSKS